MRLRRSAVTLLALCCSALGLATLAVAPPAEALSPDVVISQLYGGGGNSGAFYRYDFIELYNRGAAPVQLAGWTLNYASSTGTFGGAGLNTTLAGFINPGEYYLVQQASGANTAAANLPTPDAIGTIAMSGTTAKVALAAPAVTCTGTTCPGNTDLVGFGAANGFETAPVAALTNTTAARRLGTPRGSTETDNNSTDFATGAPTPVSTGRGFFSCSAGTVAIASVQGAGATSPCSGQVVTVEGVVTGWDDKRGQSAACALFTEDAGIWIQTPDATNDANPATSDGIFVGRVFPRASYPLGTSVRVTGTVEEKFGLTQITSASLTPTVLSSGNALPTPVVIDAATAQAQNLITKPYYESLESMRVTASGIANSGGTNRFGELFLEPGTGPIDTLLRTSSTARLDALLGTASDAGAGDPAIPRTNPPSTTDVLADKGDTVTGLTGPLTFSFSNYKVMPQIGALPTITKTGVVFPYDRLPAAPASAVRVASFNMENYFPTGGTLDCTTVSAAENVDKTARLSDAVGRLLRAPDVLAVQEVVDLPTLQQLATELGADGYGTYAPYLIEGNDNRGIDNGFLVKNTVTVQSVTQFGKTQTEPGPGTNCTSDIAGLLFDRPPLVLEFTSPDLVGTYAVISNHFASKANPDEQCRAKQAAFNRDIAASLRTAGKKVMVTGDINAFEDEPALTTLTAPGTNLTNLWSTAPADQRYSFQFNGLLQTLDHMVVDDGVLPSVIGFQYGHFDADYFFRPTAGDGHHVSDHSPPVLTLAATAPACGVPTGHTVGGFDCRPDVVQVKGAESGIGVASQLGRLYSSSPGCATNNTVAPYDDCVVGQAGPGAGAYGDWDHDLVVNMAGSNSTTGLAQLANPALGPNRVDLVRSVIGAGGAANTNWAFASEGVAVVAVNPAARARTTSTLNVTQALLQAVYEGGNGVCDSTVTWAALGDTGPNAADPVLPFGMAPSADAFGVFDTYLGGGLATADCLVPGPYLPGENDVAALKAPIADAATAARFASGQGLWWFTGSVLSSAPVRAAGLSPVLLGGVSYASTTYGLRRTVSFVTRDTDASFCTGVGAPVAGCAAASTTANASMGADVAGGRSGALREFVRFVCRTGRQLSDPSTQGRSTALPYVTAISGAIQQAGYSTTVPGANFGRCQGS